MEHVYDHSKDFIVGGMWDPREIYEIMRPLLTSVQLFKNSLISWKIDKS